MCVTEVAKTLCVNTVAATAAHCATPANAFAECGSWKQRRRLHIRDGYRCVPVRAAAQLSSSLVASWMHLAGIEPRRCVVKAAAAADAHTWASAGPRASVPLLNQCASAGPYHRYLAQHSDVARPLGRLDPHDGSDCRAYRITVWPLSDLRWCGVSQGCVVALGSVQDNALYMAVPWALAPASTSQGVHGLIVSIRGDACYHAPASAGDCR
jgi:hypothetical protein